jgi:hypothetical protein
MTTLGRHPNVLIGSLLAAVVVLAFVALVGLGVPPRSTDASPSVVSASVPASPSSPTPSSPEPSSIPPSAPVIPSMTEIAPGVLADCGRIGPAACQQAIALARAGNEADLVGTTLIVVDDTCPPATECDPPLPFDAIVVFATAGGDTTGWYAFHVFKLGDNPTTAERWQNEIPPHIVDRIRAALATP